MNRQKSGKTFEQVGRTSVVRVPLMLVVLAMMAIATACGTGSDDRNPLLPVGPATVLPATAVVPAAPTATLTPEPTAEPSPTPAPTVTPAPRPTPMPTQAPTSTPIPAPTSAPVTESASSGLPAECRTDGSLTDSKLIATCSFIAMSLLRTVRADVDFNLGSLMSLGPLSGAEIPSIKMQVDRVLPEDFRLAMTGPGGEMLEIILVDGSSYISDGASGEWVKVPQSPEETAAMLMSLNMVEQQLNELDDENIVWGEPIVSEDGAEYVVSYQPPADQTGLQAPGMELQLNIDSETFLQNSVLLRLIDGEGTGLTIASFTYSEHNAPLVIEAPESYIEADPSMMMPPGPGDATAGDAPHVLSLSKNAEGNVDVTFSEPVTLMGDVGLYVLEPSIGGYSLPYLGGSGTDVLTFSADVPDHPPLVPGESLILGFEFDAPESDLVGESGNFADTTFDEWVYPE